jgi:Tfp pilus assembly protein PilO
MVSITTLKKSITEYEKTSKLLKAKIKNLQVASTQLESIKNFLPILDTNIPNNGASYTTLTNSIEALAAQSGIKLETGSLGATLLFSRLISPFSPDKDQSVVALPFNIRASGGYVELNLFLTNILKMERVLLVDSVSINPQIGSNRNKMSAGSLVLNISGSAYYLANEAQITKAITEDKGKK